MVAIANSTSTTVSKAEGGTKTLTSSTTPTQLVNNNTIIIVPSDSKNSSEILHAEDDYNEMLSTVYRLISKYDIDKVYIDGANPSFIKSLKLQIGEDPDYDKVIARYKSQNLGTNWSQDMKMLLSISIQSTKPC
jgi:hypothetical protein